MRLIIISTFFACISGASLAQDFDLSFGGGTIGRLSVSQTRVVSDVTSAPMGVGNGRFEAIEQAGPDQTRRYQSFSPKKGRRISVILAGGQVQETTVSPSKDQTALSTATAVPSGVITPVSAINRLIHANGCPPALQFYDGRRVISVRPDGEKQTDGALHCDMAYGVTHGPGHLSPLLIKQAALGITYDTSSGQRMTELSISSGPFTLYVRP